MDNEAEKKKIIENLINYWLELLPNSIRHSPNWQEEDVKAAMRRKAYAEYGIVA